MMGNDLLADHVRLLAEAEANGSYLRLRSVLRALTLDEIRQIKNVVGALKEEIDEYERKASL